jgi:hypothetical protein
LLEAIFVIGLQMHKSPSEMPGDFSFERHNLTILLTLLAALLTAATLLAALLAALASGLLLLLAGLLLTALLTPLLTTLLLPALLHVAHFVVRHRGTLLRGRIPRDDKLFAPRLVPQQTTGRSSNAGTTA